MSLGASYWRARLANWPPCPPLSEGYTLLLPVPGDLPVFLELALAVCAEQSSKYRHRTLVLPDRWTTEIKGVVERARSSWEGPIEVVPFPVPERWALPYLRSGSRNHGLQLITGVAASTTSHVILHDADLFVLGRDLFDAQYQDCRDRGLACLGVSPVWDLWYAEHGRQLAATWELCAETAWLRAWPPSDHIGHDGVLWEQKHTFDTTLYPQALSEASRIGVNEVPGEFVHFNYVISTYRKWQRRRGEIFDDRFLVLLIRVFVDLFAADPGSYHLPSADELARGLGAPPAVPVTYPDRVEGSKAYMSFRMQLSEALSGPWGQGRRQRLDSVLAPFDDYYAPER